MGDGSIAAALLNRTDAGAEIELRWRDLGLLDNEKLHVRDLWARQDVGEAREKLVRPVPAHGTVMLRLSGS
jgi:alpha-galactosidase